MRPHTKLSAIAVALSLTGASCAPRELSGDLRWTIRTSGTHNAESQGVRGWSCLRVNAFLLDELADIQAIVDPADARKEMLGILAAAYEEARYAYDNEIDRLSERSLRHVWHHTVRGEPQPPDVREAIRSRFWAVADAQYAALRRQTEAAECAEDIHQLARSIQRTAEPSPEQRHGRGILLAIVAASVKEDRGPLDHGGPLVDLYEPDRSSAASAGDSRSREDALLLKYAPTIVQERIEETPYEARIDRIGTVRLEGSGPEETVVIDTRRASVYGYWQHTWVNGRRHLQLTYTQWFPAHPKFKPIDPEAGDIEGTTLRITLDDQQRPAIFETVLNCGCFHRCYPASSVERSSCEQYGGPADDKQFCVEKAVPHRMDWIIPETVDVPSDGTTGPLLFSRAGYHGLAGISFDRNELTTRTIHERRSYTLRSYDELERLPTENGFGSMFRPDGLVRGAERLEGALLAPTGMFKAGQPRQRGTQRLHWDQYDFDDPHLFDNPATL